MAKNKNMVVELVETTTEIEAPYELPEGWKWCRLGELFSHVTGKALKKENQKGIKKRYITTSNIYWGTFDFSEIREMYFEENELDKCTAKKGDLLVCNGGDIGRSAIWNYDYDICLQNHVSKLRKLNNTVLPQFYYYLMLFYKNSGFLNGKGIGISSLSAKDLLNLTVPVSTLEEQQRIVNRIETLFAKLDQAKEKAQNVVDTFETRKASILHKAFTGELTKKWREENGVGDDSWEEKTIGECCQVKGGKRVPKGMSLIKTPNEHPYLKAGNLKNGTVIDKDLEYVPDDVLGFIKNYTVQTNDLYITNVGACIGDCGIIPEKYNGANLTENAVKLTELNCNNNYLAIQLSSNIVQQQISEKIKSATLGKLSIDNIKQLKINIPTLSEQQEIVRIVDVILEKENKAKESAKAVLEQIDLLKKSILARAFRGEL